MPLVSRKLALNLCLLALVVVLWLLGRGARAGEILPVARSSRVERELRLLVAPPRPVLQLTPTVAASRSAQLAREISASSALALDVDSKLVLWEKNATTPNYPASTTKIVTALVARDLYDLDDELEITTADLQYGQNLSWQVGERVSVRDLLQALLIVSANEAGMILADHAPGGYDAFVAAMNAKAAGLALAQTSFENPQGFDADRQQMSAHDLALASLELLRDDFLETVVATPATTITTSTGRQLHLTNTNQLLTNDQLAYRVRGIKTGTTALANEALVSLLEQDGHEIIVVVLSAKTRYNDTQQIADYVFGNYVWQVTTKE